MIITKCGSHYKNTLIPTGSQVMTAKNTDGQQVVLMLHRVLTDSFMHIHLDLDNIHCRYSLDLDYAFTLEVKWR